MGKYRSRTYKLPNILKRYSHSNLIFVENINIIQKQSRIKTKFCLYHKSWKSIICIKLFLRFFLTVSVSEIFYIDKNDTNYNIHNRQHKILIDSHIFHI